MDYAPFEIMNKFETHCDRPVQTSGFIGQWSDAYVRKYGFYEITLRDLKYPAIDDKSYEILCILPVRDGTILGMNAKQLNDLLIKAVHNSSRTTVLGRLMAEFQKAFDIRKMVLIADELKIEG